MELKPIVDKVKKEIEKAPEIDGLCFYAANNLKYDLDSENIESEIFNIRDLADIDFDHYFILAKLDNDYLIDLTYSQFARKKGMNIRFFDNWPEEVLKSTKEGEQLLNNLIKDGYSLINDDLFYQYIHSFNEKIEPFFTIEDVKIR